MKQDRSLSRIIPYYQKEMQYLLNRGRQFSSQYPKVARYLDLGETGSHDPHVQRLLESFAFLTGKLQCEIEDHFSSLSTSLLDVLYPQFTQPIPSSTVIQIKPTVEMGKQICGQVVSKGTQLMATAEGGQVCRFQTTADLTLAPLEVEDVSCIRSQLCDIPIHYLQSPWVLRIRVKSYAGDLSLLPVSSLSFHLSGDVLTRYKLFEWLFTYHAQAPTPIFIQPEGTSTPTLLPQDALQPLGFREEEALLPAPEQSHPAYRLLLEYFVFPQKFLFFQIQKLSKLQGNGFDVLVPLGEHVQPENVPLSKQHVQLNCVPATNLFQKTSEPIRLDHRQLEYKLVGDQRQENTTEIHSILKVAASADHRENLEVYAPYFTFNHDVQMSASPCFWLARREHTTLENVFGTDIFLSFVDHQLDPLLPPHQTLYAHALCTNRDLAVRVPAGAQLQPQGSLTGVIAKTLERPTPEIVPHLDGVDQWRLISHLSINHVGLCTANQSVEPLRELLRLYNFVEHSGRQSEAEAILSLSHQKGLGRVYSGAWMGFTPKVSIDLTVDESRPNTHGIFLLSLVLDEVFKLCAGFNVLIETKLMSHHRQKAWKTWPARTGTQPCL